MLGRLNLSSWQEKEMKEIQKCLQERERRKGRHGGEQRRCGMREKVTAWLGPQGAKSTAADGYFFHPDRRDKHQRLWCNLTTASTCTAVPRDVPSALYFLSDQRRTGGHVCEIKPQVESMWKRECRLVLYSDTRLCFPVCFMLSCSVNCADTSAYHMGVYRSNSCRHKLHKAQLQALIHWWYHAENMLELVSGCLPTADHLNAMSNYYFDLFSAR